MPIPGEYISGTIPKTPLWRLAQGATAPTIYKATVKSGATFQYGEQITLTSGEADNLGTIADPSADGVGASLIAGDLVLGMALQPASGNTTVDVIVANDAVEFFGRVRGANAGASELQDVAYGDLAELLRYNGAGEIQTVLTAAPNGTDALNKAQIVNKPAARSATDQYPGVWYTVRPAYRVIV